jgi:hypothetical protein
MVMEQGIGLEHLHVTQPPAQLRQESETDIYVIRRVRQFRADDQYPAIERRRDKKLSITA